MGLIIYSEVINLVWTPPGKNCGACGQKDCVTFTDAVNAGVLRDCDCPFFSSDTQTKIPLPSEYQTEDILGDPIDFVLNPLPGEVSARKLLLPFRPDLVERWNIQPGEIVIGRPMGAGCPVQHVLQVISASLVSGVLICHVVGPAFSRGKAVKDLEAYHMIGFEGIAIPVRKEPEFGRRMKFLPGFCMMNLGHTGVVNMILNTSAGLHVRIEDIRLL